MTSPFSTFQEFSEAKGPIYTFANSSAAIGFFLLVSLAISVYFFYASFGLKQEQSPSQTAKTLGALLLAGGMSLFSTLSQPQKQPDSTRSTRYEARSNRPSWQPFVALGLMGIGSTSLGRKTRRKVKRSSLQGTAKQSTRAGSRGRSIR
ncbi:hypothetical protein [Leptolyngbya sp. FACHB-711]|uniref:hypothetical protein n=1 Tax=unclassified Leptolyngbya TaxID=2650499 RepID=UPI0016883E21|nr:hypothetical protein [Leptolyngbya sp. FACHB-711]MBD1850860.1 hypothetical protein [Cyanobacteria bacterium FACHB-502]MBD2023988.1 hypothetical protein [Leptolyngbya sp. FACHB-711]